MQAQWVKNTNGDWCHLEVVDLSNVTAIGVYVIWHEGSPSRTVRVGQGVIKDRLTAHRADPDILAFRKYGKLRVTWAAVPAADLDGVERYLANCYRPLVAERFPDAAPVQVNLP